MKLNKKLGWLKDYADIRDFSPEHNMIKPMLTKIRKPPLNNKPDLPEKMDLRSLCSPVEDQEDIGSCTANAGVAQLNTLRTRPTKSFLMPQGYSCIR